ncbi:polysaccharide pyruvyl transferase family protein [Elusimicrobiota bacterium]
MNIFDVIYGVITWTLVQVLGIVVEALEFCGFKINDRWEPGKKLQILFLAYSGARNTGAEVRVAECIDQVNQVLGEDNVDVNMTTLDIAEAKEYFKANKVNLHIMSTVFFGDVFKLCLKNHVIVLVEGSCWKENFATALLLYFLYGAGLAAKFKKPCFSYGVDAGTMNGFNNLLSRSLSKNMTRLIVRSGDSKKVLDSIGLKGSVVRVDTAWSLRADSLERGADILKERGWDGKSPLVGLAMQNFFWWPIIPDFVRWLKRDKEYNYKLLYYYDYSEKDKQAYNKWKDTLAEYMDWLKEKYNAQLVVVAMEALDDGACRELMSVMKNKAILISCKEFVGVQMAAILRNLNILTTTRYHAMVLSMPAAVPFVGLSRDERIRGVMRETGLYDDYYVDYSRPDLAEALRSRTSRLLEDKAEYARVSGVIKNNLPYYFAQMALLGLDIRNLIKESFPKISLKTIDETNPSSLTPYFPAEMKQDVEREFVKLQK